MRNPALIRVVASRYHELRGLQTAGDASLLIGIGAGIVAAEAVDAGRLGGFAMTILAVLLCGWFVCWLSVARRRLERFYETRFGRVKPKRFEYPYALMFAIGTGWIQMWCGIPGPLWVRAPLALAVAIPLVVWPGWFARRDAPFRTYWALVALAALVMVLRAPFGDASAQYVWRAHTLLFGGAALMIAGVGDHLLVVRTLRPADDDGTVTESGRHSRA